MLWWSPNRKPIRRYMSFGSLSEMERALYAIRVPTVDRTRLSRTRPSVSGGTDVRRPASSQPQNSGAIDHWSIVLLYSMGFGTVAVAALLFLVLMVVCLYGQLVWSFTYWDLANVRLTPFKSLAYFILLGTFVGGTCVGLWCFSGAAWRKSNSTAARRRTR
jgi:hypothetical protein